MYVPPASGMDPGLRRGCEQRAGEPGALGSCDGHCDSGAQHPGVLQKQSLSAAEHGACLPALCCRNDMKSVLPALCCHVRRCERLAHLQVCIVPAPPCTAKYSSSAMPGDCAVRWHMRAFLPHQPQGTLHGHAAVTVR